jgi:hypothetical protein
MRYISALPHRSQIILPSRGVAAFTAVIRRAEMSGERVEAEAARNEPVALVSDIRGIIAYG